MSAKGQFHYEDSEAKLGVSGGGGGPDNVDGMDVAALADRVQEVKPGGVLQRGAKARGGGSGAAAAEARRVRQRVAEEKAAAAEKRLREEEEAREAEREEETARLEAEMKAAQDAEARAAARAKGPTGQWHEADHVAEGDAEVHERIVKNRPRTAAEDASYKLKVVPSQDDTLRHAAPRSRHAPLTTPTLRTTHHATLRHAHATPRTAPLATPIDEIADAGHGRTSAGEG